jgi:hypothetical protein
MSFRFAGVALEIARSPWTGVKPPLGGVVLPEPEEQHRIFNQAITPTWEES